MVESICANSIAWIAWFGRQWAAGVLKLTLFCFPRVRRIRHFNYTLFAVPPHTWVSFYIDSAYTIQNGTYNRET